MKILIATQKPFEAASKQAIIEMGEKLGQNLIWLEKYATKDDLIKVIPDAEALVVRSDVVDEAVIDAAAKLKIVVRAGAGYNTIKTDYAKQKGVCVMNTPGQNSNAVAEAVFAYVLFMARSHLTGKPGLEIKGKTIGLHGFGYVGRAVVPIAKGFGMKVLAHDPFLSKEDFEKLGVEMVELDRLYKESNIISVHVPLNPKTKGLVTYELMKELPAESFIVNTARDEIFNEEDIVKIMKDEKKNIKYVADFPLKNKKLNEELIELTKGTTRFYRPGVKLGAQTREANTNAGCAGLEQIQRFFDKDDRTFQVNK